MMYKLNISRECPLRDYENDGVYDTYLEAKQAALELMLECVKWVSMGERWYLSYRWDDDTLVMRTEHDTSTEVTICTIEEMCSESVDRLLGS